MTTEIKSKWSLLDWTVTLNLKPSTAFFPFKYKSSTWLASLRKEHKSIVLSFNFFFSICLLLYCFLRVSENRNANAENQHYFSKKCTTRHWDSSKMYKLVYVQCALQPYTGCIIQWNPKDCSMTILYAFSEEKKLNVADVTEMHMCVLMYSREFWIYYYLQ